jgi:hypothetical protein
MESWRMSVAAVRSQRKKSKVLEDKVFSLVGAPELEPRTRRLSASYFQSHFKVFSAAYRAEPSSFSRTAMSVELSTT